MLSDQNRDALTIIVKEMTRDLRDNLRALDRENRLSCAYSEMLLNKVCITTSSSTAILLEEMAGCPGQLCMPMRYLSSSTSISVY